MFFNFWSIIIFLSIKKGHKWQATPNNIKSHDNWCIKCDKEKESINT